MTENKKWSGVELALSNSESYAEGLQGLPSLPPPSPVVKSLWYNNKTIKVDGWSFESCRFDNCKIKVASPYFSFKDCFFDKRCVIQWDNSIIPIIQLYNYQEGVDARLPFNAVCNPDGTFTIG